LWENKLTRIPDQISFFKKLSYVNLFDNPILSVPRGSLAFHPGIQVSFLILTRNALERIESDAFQGKLLASVYIFSPNVK
jgi:Leucine-rich repeat (LRR) protein